MIICTGPISSGTRMMADILIGWGLEAEHRSMPQWQDFWKWQDFPADARFVIITRRPDFSVRSAWHSGHGNPSLYGWSGLDHRMDEGELMTWWWKALDILADFPRAWWLSYEAIVANPKQQLSNLAHWLGLEAGQRMPIIFDANEKWR